MKQTKSQPLTTRARVVCLSLTLLALALAAAAGAQTSVGASPQTLSLAPYHTGERLSYSVTFSNFQAAAHVEFFVAGRTSVKGREAVELRAHVETIGVVRVALYSVDNDYTSFVEPATGLPLRTRQVVREGAGGTPSDTARDYTQPAAPSVVPAQAAPVGLPGTYDFVSALYRLRALPLAPGSAYRLNVQGPTETYDTEITVTGRELLNTNIGSINALVARVRVRDNKLANDYRVQIYFSDDERHIPVLITARHPSGEIRAEIASAGFVNEAQPTPTPNATRRNPQPGTNLTLPPGGVAARPSPGATFNTPSAGTGASPADAAPLSGLPFSVGEQLNFSFYLGTSPQPVGTATLQVRARAKYFNRDGLLFAATIQTVGAGQKYFPVSDAISSYVDAATLLPFRSEQRLQEGRSRRNWVVSFDQDRGGAVFDDATRLEIPVGTHDLISVLYALRSFDLTPPRRNAVSILINKRPRALLISSLRRETIQVGTQSLPAIQLSLATDEVNTGDRLQLRLWVSADRRRLPLRIVAATPLGPVRADLAIIPVEVQ